MSEENQEPKKTNPNEQTPDNSRSPGVDRRTASSSPGTDRSPGVDRGADSSSSENETKNNNTEEPNKNS